MNRDYESMSLEELKTIARDKGIVLGNIGKEKLISRIQEKDFESQMLQDVMMDTDLDEIVEDENLNVDFEEEKEIKKENESGSILDSISSVIDDLDDSENEEVEVIEELPLDTVIPVKSITYGVLIYKSRTTNVTFRWNKIGAIEYMTVAELNEMNNYKESFLQKPYVILMDERAIKKFRLTHIYENVAKINNLTSILNSNDLQLIEKTIDDGLNVNMRSVLISKIRQMYNNQKLTNINTIRLLEKKLNFDLSDSE